MSGAAAGVSGDAAGVSGAAAGVSGSAAGAGAGGSAAGSGVTAALTALTVGAASSGVSGSAKFSAKANAVSVTVDIAGCTAGKAYPVHIHTGTSCDTPETQMGHWDMTRGEGIPSIPCVGTTGTVTYERVDTDPTLAWTIGGAANNIVGHVVVVHDPDNTRLACGKIL
ncbi:MAG: Copper/zinc superoxide dismutase [Pseudomonadota bacterium]